MRPAVVSQTLAGRNGHDLFAAGTARLAAELAATNTRVVLARAMNYAQLLDDPLQAYGAALRGAGGGNVILIVDFSHEGVAFRPRLAKALGMLAAAVPDGRLGVVLVNNNARLVDDFRAHGAPLPVVGHGYHHHAHTFLRTCRAENYAQTGMALIDRAAPLKAVLCLNNTARLHRMLAVLFLARELPGDHVATFGGFARSKVDVGQVLAQGARSFPAAGDPDVLAQRVRALGLPAVTDPDLPWEMLIHGVEPESYAKTFASLVTETEMTGGEIVRYTEKLLKPLAMGHPVVVLGNPHTVALAEGLGFDMLRDVVDQSYDAIADPQERLAAAQRSVAALARLDQAGRAEVLRRHRDRLAGNVAQFDGRLLAALETRWRDETEAAVRALLREFAGGAGLPAVVSERARVAAHAAGDPAPAVAAPASPPAAVAERPAAGGSQRPPPAVASAAETAPDDLEQLKGRFSGYPLFAAAVAQLAPDLAAADARVVYAITPHYGDLLRDVLGTIRPFRPTRSQRRNLVLIFDLSNEGVPMVPGFVRMLETLKAAHTGGRLGVVFVQTNAAFEPAARAVALPLPVAFNDYHHHAMTFLRTCLAAGVARQGTALLDRPGPLRAFLCLNKTPRLHRLLALVFLARNFPGDYHATFDGFARSKLDWRKVVDINRKYFPSVDVDALVERVGTIDVSPLTDPGLGMHALAHEVEPETYAATFASLVTETEMTSGAIVRYTEKLLKPFAMGHPAIVAGNVGTLPLVEALGFDVLRDAVDQSYDAVRNPERRLDGMKRAARKLARLSQEERLAFLRRHRDALGRNVEKFDGRLLREMETRFRAGMVAAIGTILREFAA